VVAVTGREVIGAEDALEQREQRLDCVEAEERREAG
jgi:hypothetical protein